MSGAGILREPPLRLDAETQVLVVGAGACGLVAALRAKSAGAEVIVLERDASPSGSTSMSSGFVPAPATRFQRAVGIQDDTPELLLADIMAKSEGRSRCEIARLAAENIGPAVEWLADHAGLEWVVLDDFLYPGHSRYRMHAVPEKTGAALEARLLTALEDVDIPVVTEAHAVNLFVNDRKITAVEIERPGESEFLACGVLVLACSGYGGNPELVRQYIPEIADGLYYGHAGNTGDALTWGKELDAGLADLSGYQGHGSLAHPHGILISWALMMRGAIQVNSHGRRFSNEFGGYSEQAVNVLAQPGKIAWNIYDSRIHEFALSFPDYRDAQEAGAIRRAPDVEGLARVTGLPPDALQDTLRQVRTLQASKMDDAFGRDFTGHPGFVGPFFAVKVTGALFHTQGGLLVDETARVLDVHGNPFPNLFAGGGAACGVSGPNVAGYLSGNGLLTAIALGFVAGANAVETVSR